LAEFTGERVIPGEVDEDLLNEHLARYFFAAPLVAGLRVLDAGCGAGYGSAELAGTAAHVTGCDCAPEAIQYARSHYSAPNLAFADGDCLALPVADASVDAVVAFEVIEHLEDWRGFLAETRRVLAPEGFLLVSTPNRLYYAEARRDAGPNQFHCHEFEFEEFRAELQAYFPHVTLMMENHAACVAFQPVGGNGDAAIRLGVPGAPEEAHFFVAVCSAVPQPPPHPFVFVPSTANVLRERERHIAKLTSELARKDEWLETAKADLSALNVDHQKLLAMYRAQADDLAARTRWAEALSRDLEERGARVNVLQDELAAEQAAARETVAAYEDTVARLEEENVRKTEWARQTEERLTAELTAKAGELARCVAFLQETEGHLEERTRWALDLDRQVGALTDRLNLVRASRWVRAGRKIGLGPALDS
jgi:O-antigen biosynthesis protein